MRAYSGFLVIYNHDSCIYSGLYTISQQLILYLLGYFWLAQSLRQPKIPVPLNKLKGFRTDYFSTQLKYWCCAPGTTITTQQCNIAVYWMHGDDIIIKSYVGVSPCLWDWPLVLLALVRVRRPGTVDAALSPPCKLLFSMAFMLSCSAASSAYWIPWAWTSCESDGAPPNLPLWMGRTKDCVIFIGESET